MNKDKSIQELKEENTKKFIKVTEELIESEGLTGVSIRKIALKSGFHNSTIYLYFEDLNELIMLASMKYLVDYSHELGKDSAIHTNSSASFLNIWDIFFDNIMNQPEIFHNFFFGKRSNRLDLTLDRYYSLFPLEKEYFTETIEAMYYGIHIYDRSLQLLLPLVNEDNLVTKQNIHIINKLIVSFFKNQLEEKKNDPSLDIAILKKDFLDSLVHILGCSKLI